MWIQLCHDLGEFTGDVQIATIYVEEEFAVLGTLQMDFELSKERGRTGVTQGVIEANVGPYGRC
jgi:hypothetical protein